MKLDMNLIIEILSYLEEREEITLIKNLQIPKYNDGVVAYHLRRMYEAGFLDAEAITSSTTPTRLISVFPFGLTWNGHEFLNSVRDQSVVLKLKKRLGVSLNEVPFTIIRELALSIWRSQVIL